MTWTEQNILWKVPVPGTGNGSPVVWKDAIFLQAASQDGGERLLACFNARDGKLQWKQSLPGASARMHRKNTLASSTPATDGKQVYAAFWDGHELLVAAYGIDGVPRWKHTLGPFVGDHGMGHSPVVVQDRVILLYDHDQGAAVVALDAGTGTLAWKAERKPFRACYSTPCVAETADGRIELLVESTQGITSYAPATGQENWSWQWQFDKDPLRTVGSPVCTKELVIATSGEGGGARHAVAVRRGGHGDVTSTHLAWELKKAIPYVPTMLCSGSHLFYVNDQGVAGCLVAATGATVWQQRLGGNVSASPVLVDGTVYAVNEDGEVFTFAAAARYKALGQYALGERVIATPAVAGGRMFIRGSEHIYCIGAGS